MKYYLNGSIVAYDRGTKRYYIYKDSEDSRAKKNPRENEVIGKRALYYFETFAGIRASSFKLAIENIKRLTNGAKPSVLDVGCSYGLFLKKVAEQGWEGFGIEPSEDEARFARERCNVEVVKTTIEEFVSDKKWDIVTLWDVFEHLPQPLDVLKKIKSVLNSDGILIIRVPNAKGLVHKLAFISYVTSFGFFNFPLIKLFENHQYIYTKHSLHEMLRKAGFEVILSYSEYMIEPHHNVIKRKSYITQLPRPLQELVCSMLISILKLSGILCMKDSLISFFKLAP